MWQMLSVQMYLVTLGGFGVNFRPEHLGKGHVRSVSTTRNRIRPFLTVLDIAYKMLASYFGIPNKAMETSFLSCNGDSLRWAFSIALALRDVCDAVVYEWNNNGVNWMYSEN